MTEVKVLYDFDAQPGSGELSIKTNEILRVTRQDVGDGWWEGVNSQGTVGLFPAGYVEPYSPTSPPPPSMPPPPLPDAYAGETQRQASTNNYDAGEDWDDDWDDDNDSTYSGHDTQSSSAPNKGTEGPDMHVMSTRFESSKNEQAGKATVRRNLNRFSTFVKSGGESYILGNSKISVPAESYVTILDNGSEIVWEPNSNAYTCTVASPKKEKKLKGLKSYISYQITPSFNNIQTSRRYKHFDWLHERLEAKFSLIPVPPLPEKQVTGRYDEGFIERRMAQLQSWVNRICNHPVMSRSEVWMHFLTCSDEKRWKAGKRRAEKDELTGAAFCHAIQAPQAPLETSSVEKQTENFSKFSAKMDESVKSLHALSLDQTKKFQGAYKREFVKVSEALIDLGSAFELEEKAYNKDLTAAIKSTGETYEKIGKLYEDQPKNDYDHLCDMMHEYKGMLASLPDILQVHKGALNKKRENKKLGEDGKLPADSLAAITQRTEVISYATLAEISHFQHERVRDFKYIMQVFLTGQINFYNQIATELQDALTKFDSVVTD